MRIEHLALWVTNLESSCAYYEKYFGAQRGELYTNPKKNFSSYFLSFSNGARLELMHNPEIPNLVGQDLERLGLVHFAISVGSKEKVNALTEELRKDGYAIIGEPRTTGDGYYESVTLDPEGNRIEITT
ncbi:VOC family protein [Flagellimonas sp.]|uniref:VOC family protein n=1 Tax=Flagellimonas sp. TaxID=2058762 RepID=UPI003B52B404